MIRQPIVCVLGHVDHGKTTLLDKVRGTAVVLAEPGQITQAIGASIIPSDVIKKACGELLEKLKIKLEIPGLLFIDSPGHEAFTSLRKRGSSIADLAILVIDINEGFRPQTDESLNFLKEFKTPFVIAATKIDKIEGWIVNKGSSFLDSFARQTEFVKERLDKKIYGFVGQISQRGFDSERFDRVKDFKKEICIVPCSGITGEGIPELLMVLAGLAQQFLKKELELKKGIGRGTILEIKELRGMGTTADVILYEGEASKGDWLVIGGKEPIVTKIKALLKPAELKELRVEKQFQSVEYITAAAGIKIAAPELEKATAGNPIAICKEHEIENMRAELKEIAEKIEFEKVGEGIILKADTLGSLEALVHILGQKRVEIKKAEVGPVLHRDIVELESVDRLKKFIFAFNVPVDAAIDKEASDKRIKIIQSDVIYKIIERYDELISKEKEEIKAEKLAKITMPAKIKLLSGFVFRASNPAIVGIEVLAGSIKPGIKLQKAGKEIGIIKAIESEGKAVEKAQKGEKVAISIGGPTVGRQIKEKDQLLSIITKDDLKILQEFDLKEDVQLAKEILGKI